MVKSELEKLGLTYTSIKLGMVETKEDLTEELMQASNLFQVKKLNKNCSAFMVGVAGLFSKILKRNVAN